MKFNIEKYFNGKYYDFNGVKIASEIRDFVPQCTKDVIFIDSFGHLLNVAEDMYDEGPYVEGDFDVFPGETVIDVGAYIGDFSAYGAYRGAKVYAFEPNSEVYRILKKTAAINDGNIIPVKSALSDKESCRILFSDNFGGSSMDLKVVYQRFRSSIFRGNYEWMMHYLSPFFKPVICDTTTLDSFVKRNKIKNIDFIKVDIEGFERYMLMGAKNIMKTMHPKLSVCTYHLPDDPVVLENIIKECNPDYKVIQNKKKLFAYTTDTF